MAKEYGYGQKKFPMKKIILIFTVIAVIAGGLMIYPYLDDILATFQTNVPVGDSRYSNPTLLLSQSNEFFNNCKTMNRDEVCLAIYYNDNSYCENDICLQLYNVIKSFYGPNPSEICENEQVLTQYNLDKTSCSCVLTKQADCDLSSLDRSIASQAFLLAYYNNDKSYCNGLVGDDSVYCLLPYAYSKAYQNNDPNECLVLTDIEGIDSEQYVHQCLTRVNNDINYCDGVCNHISLSQKANINGDTSFCNQIPLTEKEQNCLAMINYDMSECVNKSISYSTDTANNYYTCVAVKNKAISVCEYVNDIDKDYCKLYVAREEYDEALCASIESVGIRDDCVLAVTRTADDATIVTE
jgi:hypothetical protein